MKKFNVFYVILPVLVAVIIILASILGVYVMKDKNKKSEYWQLKYDSFVVQNANLSKGQIVFVGDSITDFYPLDDYYADLNLATYNRGIGGDTTGGLLDRMKVSLYDLAPSKIVLMIGINDIFGGGKNNAYVKKQAFASVFLPDRLAIIAFPVFILNFFHGLVEPVAFE